MDLATLLGLLIGIVFLLFGILSTDLSLANLAMFWEPRSLFIVGGGTLAATFVSFPLRTILNSWRVAIGAFLHRPESAPEEVDRMVSYAQVARRDGVLALEAHARESADPFVAKSLRLAVDGTTPEVLEEILEHEILAISERHEAGRQVFAALARYAPAWGMIGTLIGLVLMLMQSSVDPSRMGVGLATALLTTFYGAVAANFLFGPIADKLRRRSEEELKLKTIVLRGIIAIQHGDNPRVVQEKLRSYLPMDDRVAPYPATGHEPAGAET
jgi:chemotaxis protein MotA